MNRKLKVGDVVEVFVANEGSCLMKLGADWKWRHVQLYNVGNAPIRTRPNGSLILEAD